MAALRCRHCAGAARNGTIQRGRATAVTGTQPRRRRRACRAAGTNSRIIGCDRDGLCRPLPQDRAARRVRELQAEGLVTFLLLVIDDLEFDELGVHILVAPRNRHGIGSEIRACVGGARDRRHGDGNRSVKIIAPVNPRLDSTELRDHLRIVVDHELAAGRPVGR